MFGTTYYHDTLRKYVILFGTLFNDVVINREDNDGNVKHSFKVPLSYAPREKLLARIEGLDDEYDPQEQPFSVVLPRMGFEITGFQYAAERKLSTINKFVNKTRTNNEDIRNYQYNPVPYDISFTLSIFVKNMTDGTRIIEQILPYFTPEFTTTVQLISDPDITLDVPLILGDISMDDVYEGSFEERRALIWTMNFTMKGFFFGPTKRQSVIKLANTNLYDATLFADITDAKGSITPPITTINVYPGQYANGAASTDPDNTVDKDQISKEENWGYITTITDFYSANT
jgi:hypothetical protein